MQDLLLRTRGLTRLQAVRPVSCNLTGSSLCSRFPHVDLFGIWLVILDVSLTSDTKIVRVA